MTGYDFVECSKLSDALGILQEVSFDLIVVGVHFDESQALNLIQAIRAAQINTPIVVIRAMKTDLADFLRSCILVVSKAYDLSSYVETEHFSSTKDIREAIEEALPAEKRSPFTQRRSKERTGRILLAASPAPRSIVQRILNGEHELLHAGTMEEAQRLFKEETFDGIICTVLFDNYRMFDLLRFAKAHAKYKKVPFICVRVLPTILDSPKAVAGLKSACEESGADGFIDISDYSDNPEQEMAEEIERILSMHIANGSGI
jgi:PleD family two-component response regulator